MSLKEFIPAIKYGKYLSSDEFDSDTILAGTLSMGTVSFTSGAVWTGTFTIDADCVIVGIYPITSTGSPTLYPVCITQSSTTATWTAPRGSAGTTTFLAVWIKSS